MCQHQTRTPALIYYVSPLPISQISELLGPGEGKDVETTLVQLQSVMVIPTDSRFSVNIHHSSAHDHVSEPSNCGLTVHHITSLLTFCLMILDIPQSAGLMRSWNWKRQSQAMQSNDPKSLRYSLAFIVESPESLQVLVGLLWPIGFGETTAQNYDPGCRAWISMSDCKPVRG